MKKNACVLLAGVLVSSFFGLAASAGAQQQSATSANNADVGLEEIVVTAQRRSEDIEKTPIAVTVINGDAIAKTGINNASDLNGLAPGVIFIGSSKTLEIGMRGIASTPVSANVSNDLSVSLFIDQVGQARASGGAGTLFDLDHIEVLQGPQGTLYGRNNTAGAVNIYTNKPVYGELSGSTAVEYGNYNLFSTEGVANVPITDDIAVRASFKTTRHDGYLSDGYDDEDDNAGRLRVAYQPNDRFEVILSGSYLQQSGKGDTSSPYPPGSPTPVGKSWDPFAGQPICPNNIFPGPGQCIGSDSVVDDRMWTTNLEANFDLLWSTLTYIGGYAHYSQDDSRFQGSSSVHQDYLQTDDYYSNELRLSSENSSAIKWVGGLYQYWEGFSQNSIQFPQQGAYNHNVIGPSNSESYAAYSQATAPVTDRFRLTGGLRFTDDLKEGDDLSTYNTATKDAPPPANTFFFSPTYRKTQVNYKVGAEYDITQDSLLYADVSTGYKAGGFYAAYKDNTFQPEKITAYQAGSKNTFFDKRLKLNADVFYYKYTNYQVQTVTVAQFNPPPTAMGLGLVTLNSQDARFYGGEIEAVFKATAHDRFDASISQLAAEYRVFNLPEIVGGLNLSGQRPDFAPPLAGRAGYSHSFDLPNGGLVDAHVQTSYSAGYWIQFEHVAGSYQTSYTKTDLDLTYTSPGGHYTVGAWARNLENAGVENTFLLLLGPKNYASANVDPPRTFGVRIGANFK